MKVLFAIEKDAGMESALDKRFGRAGCFLVYDMDEQRTLSVAENRFKNEGHGVGIKTATYVIEKGCHAVIGAQPGPKALSVLDQANVKVIVEHNGTVKEALEKHKSELRTQ